MKTRTVALIIFYDENKKILLQDRKTISKWGEEWGFFGGGLVKGRKRRSATRSRFSRACDGSHSFRRDERTVDDYSDDYGVRFGIHPLVI